MPLIRSVPGGHDGVVFLRARRHFEIVRNAVRGNHQGVIPASEEGLVDAREHALAIVPAGGRRAVHRRLGARYGAAVDHADRLMTETHAEKRRPRTESLDHLWRDAGVLGTAGPREDHDLIE